MAVVAVWVVAVVFFVFVFLRMPAGYASLGGEGAQTSWGVAVISLLLLLLILNACVKRYW